jgi:hypothetical protein
MPAGGMPRRSARPSPSQVQYNQQLVVSSKLAQVVPFSEPELSSILVVSFSEPELSSILVVPFSEAELSSILVVPFSEPFQKLS